MLTADQAEELARDAMRFLADVIKDEGVWSGELELLLLKGVFRTWTPEQRAQMADMIAANSDDFIHKATIATPVANMAKIYIAWLLRNTGPTNG